MIYVVTLTEDQMQALAGMLDAATKALGLRAVTKDVLGVLNAIEASEQRPAEEAKPNG